MKYGTKIFNDCCSNSSLPHSYGRPPNSKMMKFHISNYAFNNANIYIESSIKDQFVSPIYGKKFTTFQKLFGEWDLLNYKENVKQWKQVLFSIIAFLFGVYFGSVLSVINEAREIKSYAYIRKLNPNFRLTDSANFSSYLHEISPWLPETFANHVVAIVILRFVVFCGPYSMRATIFRRTFVLMSILYFSKGICQLSTTLPASDPSSTSFLPDYDLNDSIFYNGLLVALRIKQNVGDMCFSGHTMVVVLFTLVYLEYTKQCPILLLPIYMYSNSWISTLWCSFLTLYVFVGIVICIICTKYHYSLDCFVAIVVTCFLHQWYYIKIRLIMFEQNPSYFIALLQWFEQHAEDLQVERKKVKELQYIVEKYQYL